MNCIEFKKHVAALALGALEPEVASACNAHLARPEPHEGCLEAYDKARTTAAQLGLALPPVRPTDVVWRALERRIGLVDTAKVPRPMLIRQLASWSLAALAAALLLFGHDRQLEAEANAGRALRAMEKVRGQANRLDVALVEARDRARAGETALLRVQAAEADREQCFDRLEVVRDHLQRQREALALLDRPNVKRIPLVPQGVGQARGTALIDPDQGRAFVLASGLPVEPGHTFQIWLLRGSRTTPAGVLVPVLDGSAVAEVDGALLAQGHEGLAVSQEPPAVGSRPTLTMMVGALQELAAKGP